jgi:hypothetical protein
MLVFMTMRKSDVVRNGQEPVNSCFALKRFCQLHRLRLDHEACLLQRRNEQYIIEQAHHTLATGFQYW